MCAPTAPSARPRNSSTAVPTMQRRNLATVVRRSSTQKTWAEAPWPRHRERRAVRGRRNYFAGSCGIAGLRTPIVKGASSCNSNVRSRRIPCRVGTPPCKCCAVSPHPRDRDLENDLSEQLQFLASSASSFDQGALSESKRIALVIRVLVHDTPNSHSLLDQLTIKNQLAWAARQGSRPSAARTGAR
jgi:hypothetical protein